MWMAWLGVKEGALAAPPFSHARARCVSPPPPSSAPPCSPNSPPIAHPPRRRSPVTDLAAATAHRRHRREESDMQTWRITIDGRSAGTASAPPTTSPSLSPVVAPPRCSLHILLSVVLLPDPRVVARVGRRWLRAAVTAVKIRCSSRRWAGSVAPLVDLWRSNEYLV